MIEKIPNIQWVLDFMHDSLYFGKRFRTLNIIDEGTRECLAIEVDTSLPAERVIRVLELISVSLLNYCEDNQIFLCHIQPGKPQQNGFIERFNDSFRREFLNTYLFESLSQVHEMMWFWQQDYNQNRTHESLNHLPLEAYRKQLENSKLVCLN